MEKSNLALALSKAQGEMRGAKKDSSNPYFKSSYADLASVWEACRDALSKNEIAVFQKTGFVEGMFGIITKMMHSSGEFEEGFFPVAVPVTAKAQEMGSAVTYARRYSLAAMVGVAPEDDDGNAAQGHKESVKQMVKNDDDLVNGLECSLKNACTMDALLRLIEHKKTNEYLGIWRTSKPADYERLMGLIETRRRELEDHKAN